MVNCSAWTGAQFSLVKQSKNSGMYWPDQEYESSQVQVGCKFASDFSPPPSKILSANIGAGRGGGGRGATESTVLVKTLPARCTTPMVMMK